MTNSGFKKFAIAAELAQRLGFDLSDDPDRTVSWPTLHHTATTSMVKPLTIKRAKIKAARKQNRRAK